MQALAATSLCNFREVIVGDPIVHVFGNGAVAVAVCEIVENNADTNRGVEMILLVKDDGVWRIAAQAWDTENVTRRIPDELLNVRATRSEEHTSELQSLRHLVCRLLLEK